MRRLWSGPTPMPRMPPSVCPACIRCSERRPTGWSRGCARENRAARRVPIGSLSPVFDVSSFTVKGRYFAGVPYEPGATNAVLTLGEGDVFVDIGANSGYFSVLAALRVGARGRVFAFEPNPAVRRQLERHIGLNAIADRVTISALALSDEDSECICGCSVMLARERRHRVAHACGRDAGPRRPSRGHLAGGPREDVRQRIQLGAVGPVVARRPDED